MFSTLPTRPLFSRLMSLPSSPAALVSLSTATSLYTLSRLPCADLTEQVYVYNDVNCTVNETTLDLGVDKCWDDTTGLNSFKAVCGRRYPTPRGSSSRSSSLPTSAFLTRDE